MVYHFVYNGWLARDVGDGHLWRELRAKKRLPKEVMTGECFWLFIVFLVILRHFSPSPSDSEQTEQMALCLQFNSCLAELFLFLFGILTFCLGY